MSAEPPPTRAPDAAPGSAIRLATLAWLIMTTFIVFSVGLEMLDGGGLVAGVALLLGLMTGNFGAATDLVAQYAGPPLAIAVGGGVVAPRSER
jgi:hypothetical protein